MAATRMSREVCMRLILMQLFSAEYVSGDLHMDPNTGYSRAGRRLLSGYDLCSLSAEEGTMLFTIAVILLVLWLLGLVSGYTLGNFIYVLLVIALVLFVVGLVSGRRTV